jgi:hypothetical protein
MMSLSWRALCFGLLLVFLAGLLQNLEVDPVGVLKRLCLEATRTLMRLKLESHKQCWYYSKAYYKLVLLMLVPVRRAQRPGLRN